MDFAPGKNEIISVADRGVLNAGAEQPHKIRSGRRQPEGDLRPAFYPAVITAELWDRAHKSIATRVTTTARGKITGKFASRTGALHNLFAGLV